VNFLEARKIVTGGVDKPQWPFWLAMSGTPDPLLVYLQAYAIKSGFQAKITTLNFGTLRQHLWSVQPTDLRECFLICPWDFVSALDWRLGIPSVTPDVESLVQEAEQAASLCKRRSNAAFVYLPAPIPPIFQYPEHGRRLAAHIQILAEQLQSRFLDPDSFSLASYFASGCPVRSASLSDVASQIVDEMIGKDGPAKVLVTDLDNTLWDGVAADVGSGGVEFRPEGRGFRHYLYQTQLKKLKDAGVVLAAVSRNDPETVRDIFAKREMVLNEEDFVAVIASYQPKSAQLRALAETLNLTLDSFVFVDDNSIELAEVSSSLPDVHCLQFPDHEDGQVKLSDKLAKLFRRRTTTAEDRERTEMYRRRMAAVVPSAEGGASILEFLRKLQMRLVVIDRTRGDRSRVVQLLNKTNQFNVNGQRWSDGEIEAVLAAGGRLFGATLEDSSGSHGEIISCLVDHSAAIRALVMSCRVFQRRVEYAFLDWLGEYLDLAEIRLDYSRTAKNSPVEIFLRDEGVEVSDGRIVLDRAVFHDNHLADRKIVRVEIHGHG
jgi:FkbH-like protein